MYGIFSVCLVLVLDVMRAQTQVIPPSITLGPPARPPTFIRMGFSYAVPCTAWGVPAPTFLWYVNGQAVPSSYIRGDGALQFNPAVATDQGYYTCKATNKGGAAISNTTQAVFALEASFAVTETGPNNIKYPVNVGDSVTIMCSPSSRGVPNPRVTIAESARALPTSDYAWKDDNNYVVDTFSTGRLQLDDMGNLLIAYVQQTDAVTGLKCWITNSVLSIISGGSPSNIIINSNTLPPSQAPAIMFYSNQTLNPPPTQQTVVLGIERRQVIMKCVFRGSPDIQVNWRKDSGLAPDPSRVITTPNNYQNSYIISNIQPSDAGVYYCKGTNAVSSTDFKIQLILEAAPRFNSIQDGPYDRNVTVGDIVTIFCKPYANPPAAVTFLINGAPLDPTLDKNKFIVNTAANSLTIKNVCKNCAGGISDTRIVQCNASNIHGYILQNGYINVLERTIINVTGQNFDISFPDPIILNVTAVSDPLTPITFSWTLNNQPLYNNTDKLYILSSGTLMVLKTGKNDLGQYACTATNGVSQDTVYFNIGNPGYGADTAYVWPYWWIPLIILIIVLLFILIVCLVCCMIYRNRGDEYPVDEKERQSGNDPEKELHESGFHDFQRPTQDRRPSQDERQPLASQSNA